MRKSGATEQFLLFGTLSLMILFIDSRGLTKPIKGGVEIPIVSVKSQVFKLSGILQYLNAWHLNEDELVRLRTQVSRLSSTSAEIAALTAENIALRQQLGVTLSRPGPLKEARPIGLTDGQLTIDIGRQSGISTGETAVLGQVLIGRIIRVSENQSVILLPISEEEKINVVVRTTTGGVKKASGLLMGQGDKMILDKVSLADQIDVGDLVMTTGDGFVRDLVVGSIGQIIPTNGQLFKKAQVDQVIDYPHLERIFIISQ